MEMICNITNDFTATFNQFNASLLNKRNTFALIYVYIYVHKYISP